MKNLNSNPHSGYSLIYKPAGISSFSCLTPIKKTLGHTKVGHAGTLDVFAEGLLIALIGGYTRLDQWFLRFSKRYIAEIQFGSETDTLDPEGTIIASAPLPSQADVAAAIAGFRGNIMQIPPAFSAIHVNGKRAYSLARAGKPVELAPRAVNIESIELASYDAGIGVIDVRCSSGTYIRSLARDIGKAAGSCGYVRKLTRLSIGPFEADLRITPYSFAPEAHIEHITPLIARAMGLAVLYETSGYGRPASRATDSAIVGCDGIGDGVGDDVMVFDNKDAALFLGKRSDYTGTMSRQSLGVRAET